MIGDFEECPTKEVAFHRIGTWEEVEHNCKAEATLVDCSAR